MSSAQRLGADRRQVLEAELAALEAELSQYQQIIDDIPLIYEDKFRQQLHALILETRRLLDERSALQRQIAGQVLSRPTSRALRSSSNQWGSWRKRCYQYCRIAVAKVKDLAVHPKALAVWLLLPVLFILSVFLGARLMVPRSSAQIESPSKKSLALPYPSRLRLRATGESWLEVRDSNDALIMETTLQAGDARSLPLPHRLKIRSGRPDLLMVAIGDAPYQAMGSIEEVGWRVYAPLDR